MAHQGESPTRDAAGLLSKGLDLHRRGMLAEAGDIYRRILAADPRHADAKHLLGVAVGSGGDIAGALDLIGEAIDLDPLISVYHYNLSKFLLDLRRWEEALAAATRAAELSPGDPLTHANRGRSLHELGRLDESLAAYEEALSKNPRLAEVHLGRASALYTAGDHAGALRSLDEALRLHPAFAEAHATRGLTIRALGRPHEGEESLLEAVRLKPGLAKAWNTLANIYRDRADFDRAVEAFERAAALDAGAIEYRANLLFTIHHDPSRDDPPLTEAARSFGAWVESGVEPFEDWPNDPDPDRPLRVGIVSPDLHRHPVAYLWEKAFGEGGDSLSWTCYSGGAKEDDVTARLRAAAAQWVPARGLSDEALARRVRDDGIDILIDLSGHTGGTRLRTFARSPAPVQATCVGSCHTTGLETIDAIIVDPVYVPEGADDLFTEKLLRLAEIRWCYSPPEYAPPVAPPPVLEEGAVTFGSFNNMTKLNGEVVDLWCRVLGAVPRSRLMLSWPSLGEEAEHRRVEGLFTARGIDSRRLILTPGTGGHHGEILGDYGKIDIVLDPFPFSGCTSTCEALWMGLPVVTLPQTRSTSRQTLGFLTVIDRLEWAAKDKDDYLRIAAALAADPEGLARMRRGQRDRVAASPMCDGPRFARHLEEGLRSLWRDWCDRRREGRQ